MFMILGEGVSACPQARQLFMGPPHTVTFKPLMHRRETLCFVNGLGVLDLVRTPRLIDIGSHLYEYDNISEQSSIPITFYLTRCTATSCIFFESSSSHSLQAVAQISTLKESPLGNSTNLEEQYRTRKNRGVVDTQDLPNV